MFNPAAVAGGQQMAPPASQGQTNQVSAANGSRLPYVKITEQPASKSLRFRYECEGRSAGSIPGVNSTPENKTYPEIQIVGYSGPAVVVVSCVTKDAPYRAHPHNLVGREGCKKGVCTLQVPQETMRVQFSNLGIQCVKKKEIDQALNNRKLIRVDPFRRGFAHIGQNSSIDLNAVRLCFQVFIADANHQNKCSLPLQPVVSDIIFDKKAISELTIVKLSHCYSFVDGGRNDMIILCEKVAKEDIAVKFYEKDENGQLLWEAQADLQPSQVHKQVGIWFKTPPYRTLDVKQPVKCYIQLWRPSDDATSDPLPFELLPRDTVTIGERGKRKRSKLDDSSQILTQLQEHERLMQQSPLNMMEMQIKTEPRETTSPYNFTGSPAAANYNPSASPYNVMGGSPYSVAPGSAGTTPQYTPQYDPQGDNNMLYRGATASTQSTTQWNIPNIASNIAQQNIQAQLTMPATLNAQMSNYQNNMPNLITQPNNAYQVFCDMDTGVNSAELPLPDSLTQLSLTDLNFEMSGMSDSLTKLANQRADDMLNN